MKTTAILERKVKAYMEEHHMLRPGERVVAGISGGADSVCLLFVLLGLREEWKLTIHVVHVNHGIREEAGEDAAFVEALCRQYDLPFTLVNADVRARAVAEKRSEEEMGRLVRYEAMEQVRARLGAERIAVAHNANDQAETMLFQLFRGSGLTGLCGIRPVRERIIRPLLCVERAQIEHYLEERQIAYCTDVTNAGDDYARNRIRHHILPYAQENVAGGCVEHMARTAQMLQETERLLENLTQQAYDKILKKNKKNCRNVVTNTEAETYSIHREQFEALDPVIGQRLLYRVLRELSPGGKDISFVHVQALEELLHRKGNAKANLPYGILAVRQYDEVYLIRQQEGGTQETMSPECPMQQTVTADQLAKGPVSMQLSDGSELIFTLLERKYPEKSQDIAQNRYTKWLDYDKMIGNLTIRTRRSGDYLTIAGPDGRMCHKALKQYLITQKIPAADRDRIPVIAQESHIVWLTSYRISEFYKISENTKHILQVQLKRNTPEGEREENNG